MCGFELSWHNLHKQAWVGRNCVVLTAFETSLILKQGLCYKKKKFPNSEKFKSLTVVTVQEAVE